MPPGWLWNWVPLVSGRSLRMSLLSLLSQGHPWECLCCLTQRTFRLGVSFMTTIAQTDCCTMLGIDPKTLRNWLRQANMPFTAHPTDARLKCLTQGQVQQLAALHDRPLSSLDTPHPARMSTKETPPPQAQEHETLLPSPSCTPQADLSQALLRLQAHVLTLQEQLNQLALAFLRECEQRSEQRLSTLEALLKPLVGPPPSPQALAETTGTDLPAPKPS